MVDNPAQIVEKGVGKEATAVLEPVLQTIEFERDLILAHACWHASFQMPRGSKGVALLGAAHTPGVAKFFDRLARDGKCTKDTCDPLSFQGSLNQAPNQKLLTAAAGLLAMSGTSMLGRWALIRHLKRTGRDRWATRFNIGSVMVAAGISAYASHRAVTNYEVVRSLQHRAIRFEQEHSAP